MSMPFFHQSNNIKNAEPIFKDIFELKNKY